MRIKEQFKRIGEFWLPSTPDTRIHGTLSISDGGLIELETIGFFADWRESLNIDLKRIVGYIQKNGSIPLIPVTLDNCTYKTIPTLVAIPSPNYPGLS